jgi:hypothetical protein
VSHLTCETVTGHTCPGGSRATLASFPRGPTWPSAPHWGSRLCGVRGSTWNIALRSTAWRAAVLYRADSGFGAIKLPTEVSDLLTIYIPHAGAGSPEKGASDGGRFVVRPQSRRVPRAIALQGGRCSGARACGGGARSGGERRFETAAFRRRFSILLGYERKHSRPPCLCSVRGRSFDLRTFGPKIVARRRAEKPSSPVTFTPPVRRRGAG